MYSVFSDFFSNVSGFLHIFSYLSVRCGSCLMMSFLFVVFLMPKYINFSIKWQKGGQPVLEKFVPQHKNKAGTPSVGGIMIISSTILSCLLFGNLKNYYMMILLFSIVSFGILGFTDDYLKITKKANNKGISPKAKLISQTAISIIIILFANYSMKSNDYSSILTFPFFKNFVLNIGIFYTLFRIFVIVGASNAVNLTDGLDGLVSMPVILICIVFSVFSYIIGNIVFSKYLFFTYQKGAQEICVFLFAIVGAILGFLWYNIKPAQIFMGDTGSLALGGTLGVVACLIKCEFLLAIVGCIFVIETVSVILQIGSVKLFKKKIFSMTPIHHSFEKKGWSEMQIVIRFWIISVVFALIGLSSLKVR